MKAKRTLFLIGCLLMAMQSYSQNPYESLGVKAEPLTLSKGKYVEFFDEEVIVQIGSVLFNTQTNEIVAFLKEDATRSEATLKPEVISRWLSPDPLAKEFPSWSPYNYVENNPIRLTDPDGRAPRDWVLGKNGIYWDKNASNQNTTKAGDTYLGKDLTFTFNSYINATFDGPNPPWGATGDKLTSKIQLTSNEDASGNLTSVDVKSSYEVHETGGLSMFKGRDYFPGLGKGQNASINISNSNNFIATFEQHASVPGLEAAGLALLGYSSVNVAQKLTLVLSGNSLSVSAATDVFPSATLSVNGNKLFQYNQPSFKATHGNDVINLGTGTSAPSIIGRPIPNFYNRYKK